MNNKLTFIKKTLYPKTKRIGGKNNVVITEKLDGSNLGIFKHKDKLLIAQRNNIFYWHPEIETDKEVRQKLYKGLYEWLNKHGADLLKSMYPDAGVFGEWIGMGRINYSERLNKKFYIFAKANITDELNINNLYYDRYLFIYPFMNQLIPDYIGVVPKVAELDNKPTVEFLNDLYLRYVIDLNNEDNELLERATTIKPLKNNDGEPIKIVDINSTKHKVEGFIIIEDNTINKYVRLKGRILQDHLPPKR